MSYLNIKHVLEKELKVAVGCTEPIAVALAAAVASEHTTGPLQKMRISCSRNVIKNAMAVAIPGMEYTGIPFVGALGFIVKQSHKQLSILEEVTVEQEKNAINWCNEGKIELVEANTKKVLLIEVSVETEREKVIVSLEDNHTNITSIIVNGVEKLTLSTLKKEKKEKKDIENYSLDDLIDFSLNCFIEDLHIVAKSIEINLAASEHGLVNEYGLQVGKVLKEQMDEGILSSDLVNIAASYAAAGSDARMGGATIPVMSNSGSGNQGLAVTLPVIAVAKKLNVDNEKMIRSVAISHLIAIFIKNQFGRLSSLCGVTIAGASSSAAITYLLGGDRKQMYYAIQNTLGNVAGMICDGAKAGCAMKVATCSSAAVQSALLAKRNKCIPKTNGFIEQDVVDTIRNFCQIGNEASPILDKVVLNAMLNKK